jgi:tetratricopeptide (TPR) repeat protein
MLPKSDRDSANLSLVMYDKIQFYLNSGDFIKAKSLAEDFKSQHPESPTIEYFLAIISDGAGDFPQALSHIDLCLAKHEQSKTDSDNEAFLEAVCLRSRILWNLGEKALSVVSLEFIARKFDYLSAYHLLVFHATEDREFERVLAYCKEGTAVTPLDIVIWFYQAQANHYLEREDAAIASLNAVFALEPNHLDGNKLAAKIYLKQRRYVKALTAAQVVLSIDERDETALSASFFTYLHLGKLELAEEIYERVIAVNPEDEDNYTEALEAMRLELRSKDLKFDRHSLYTSGSIAYRQGEFEQALSLYTSALSLAQGIDPAIELAIATTLSKLNRWSEAIEHYEAIEPGGLSREEQLATYAGWGTALITENRPKEAVLLLELALKMSPETVDIQIALAICYGALGRISEAIALSERALDFTPTATDIAIVLATHLLSQGAIGRACEVAAKVMKAAPLDPKSHYISGMVYSQLGQNVIAIKFAAFFLVKFPGEQMGIDLYMRISNALDRELGIDRRQSN